MIAKICRIALECIEIYKFYYKELKNQRDRLKQLQKKIAIQIEKEREAARQLLKDGKKE